jgi:hypothetical protein
MMDISTLDPDKFLSFSALTSVDPDVVTVDGTLSPCGRIFLVHGREVFVARRWECRQGVDWCIIDFTAPGTGYVAERYGKLVRSLVMETDHQKELLSTEDEGALFRHFEKILEQNVVVTPSGQCYKPNVEIVRLYPAEKKNTKQAETEGLELCVA